MSGKGGVDGGEGVACGPGDGVPDRPDLQPDEVIELVATVAGRGQSEPAPGRDLGDRERERSCGHVVALVDDDKAVVLGPRGHVVVSSEGLEGCDVEHAGGLGPAAAALSDLAPSSSRRRARHWSASALRSTGTSVDTPKDAMTADAMTVLPAPGGATSTPRS